MTARAAALSIAVTLLLSQAALAQKDQSAAHDLDQMGRVAGTYALTLDNLHKVVAVNDTFARKADSDATLRQHLIENDQFQGSLDELLKHFENDAVLAAVVKAGGLTVHDYLYTTMAAEVSAIAAEAEPDTSTLSATGRANIALAKAHPDDFEAFSASDDRLDRASHGRGGRR